MMAGEIIYETGKDVYNQTYCGQLPQKPLPKIFLPVHSSQM
jgi:hypothetical protein